MLLDLKRIFHSGLGLNAEKVRADLQQQQDILQGLGVEFHNFFLDPATFDSTEDLSHALQSRYFDVVVIGGGVRLPTENLLWFEKVVNLVHSKAPGAKISFNVGPDSTAEAVQRWL